MLRIETAASRRATSKIFGLAPARSRVSRHSTLVRSLWLTEAGRPIGSLGAFTSFDTLTLIGERPSIGRDFREEDDRPGAPAVTILAGGLWKSRFASDPAIIGRAIRINGQPVTVIGVMPDGFQFPNGADLWQPLSLMPGFATESRGVRNLGVFGRLRDGVALAQARTELNAVADAIARAHPDTNRDIRPWLMPINERYNGKLTEPVWQAFIAAGILVALIASANVANLLLARSAIRVREIAIRASLGATRFRIVRQLLVESLLLAICGGMAGVAVSAVGLRLFALAASPNVLPYWVTLTMDGRVFAALALVSVGDGSGVRPRARTAGVADRRPRSAEEWRQPSAVARAADAGPTDF